MHVLFITSWFETPSRPTAGKAVKDLAIALHRQGISVSILFQSFERLPWQSKSGVIDVFHFRSVSRTKFYPVFNLGPLKKGIHHFQEYVNKKGKPDLIHIHSYSSLALGHEIYRLFKIPFLYTEHSSQVAEQKIGLIKRGIIKFYLKESKATVAVSQYLKKAMLGINSNARIIPNTIDFDFFVPGVSRKEERLIMINLLTENKQVYKGINAFKHWKSKYGHAEMYIIGDGPEKSSLLRIAANENVHFQGEQKESDWIEILQSSACLLLMSKSESFGVVVLEALACHIPVICFDNGGVKEIAQWIPNTHMLSILDSSASDMAIAAAIDASIKNFSIDEAIRVRKVLNNKFGYTPVSSAYIEVYNEIRNRN